MATWTAYLNGRWIDAADLCIGIDDSGFLLGTTVTERLRTFGGEIFRLEQHIARLRQSLAIVGFDVDAVADEIACAIVEFVARNFGLVESDDDLSIIAFATPGVIGSGRPTICVHGNPLPFGAWAGDFDTGVAAVISDVRQVPPSCWPPELKCRSRMHFYLADREAARRRPRARAILLDQDGYIAEGTTANVVVYREGEGLVTPPPDHILWGVSVGTLEELASKLDIPFTQRPLTVDELRGADEALFASTSVCALAIVECDGRPIGAGQPGPIYQRLLSAWNKLVGLDIAAQARRCATRRD